MKKGTENSPEDVASDKNHEAYGRGAKLFEQGRYSLAKNEFKAALDYWPEDAEAWMALGNCFDEMNKPERAEKCFREALLHCTDRRKPDIYFNLGNSLLDQCLFEEAIGCYQQVTAQSSVYGRAQINLERAKNGKC